MEDHRSLEAWREARAVANACIALSRDAWKPWCSPVLTQLQRAALSVRLNIAEGYAFGHTATCARHYAIAYGSAIEAGELLDTLQEVNAVDLTILNDILSRNRRCQRLMLGLLKRARRLSD